MCTVHSKVIFFLFFSYLLAVGHSTASRSASWTSVRKRHAPPSGRRCQALRTPCLLPFLPSPVSGGSLKSYVFLVILFDVPVVLIVNELSFVFWILGFWYSSEQRNGTSPALQLQPLGLNHRHGLLGQVPSWEGLGRGRPLTGSARKGGYGAGCEIVSLPSTNQESCC